MAIWDDVISERDKLIYQRAGYGRKGGLGRRPAVLVVDVNYNFVGDKPEPILKSIERFHNSCGEEGWKGVYAIRELLAAARSKNVPVFYSTGMPRKHVSEAGRWAAKNVRTAEAVNPEEEDFGNRIPTEIAPAENDIVIQKEKPSAFFGTALVSHLIQMGIDSLLICGTTTSGCVRATVIDAFSYNFQVAIVQEGTFDRGEVSHKVNLFDMNAKYADVISLEEAKNYLNNL